jgi:hypothetical protein
MTTMSEIVLTLDEVRGLRDGGSIVADVPGGKIQVCGPGSVVFEFVDAANLYLSSGELDLIEADAAGQIVNVNGVGYQVRTDGAPS